MRCPITASPAGTAYASRLSPRRQALRRLFPHRGVTLGPRLAAQRDELLALARAVAERLVATRMVLRRAVAVVGPVPGGCPHGEERIDQVRPRERDEVG